MKIEDTVNGIFTRLTAGELVEQASLIQDGWEVELPSGKMVARSTLQAEARPLIALGADAVPLLLPWVAHANPALRYVAIYTLEQITGEKPQLSYFDKAGLGEDRNRAVEVWRKWYQSSTKNQ